MKVDDVKAELGGDAELVEVKELNYTIIVKAKSFIRPKEKWSEINNIIREFGGKYISDGKDSRWEIPKEEAKSTATSSVPEKVLTSDKKDNLIKDALEYANAIENQIGILKEKLGLNLIERQVGILKEKLKELQK